MQATSLTQMLYYLAAIFTIYWKFDIFITCFQVIGKQGKRNVIVNEHFYTGYRRNVVNKDEILLSLFFPYTKENQFFCAYKQAKRRDDDIAIVNAAIFLELDLETNVISDIRMAFGGMAPTTVLALKTREALIGKYWNDQILDVAYQNLLQDLPLAASAPGGMIQYRRALTLSLFFKVSSASTPFPDKGGESSIARLLLAQAYKKIR